MIPDDRNKLRGIVLDRLESLQQAGVLQLPKVRGVVPKSVDAAAPPQELASAQSTLPRETTNESAAAQADSEKRPSGTKAAKELTEAMPKKSSWQPAAASSLFEAPPRQVGERSGHNS